MTRPAIAFLWHMHQPLYRLRGERACFMPWVRLHAIRSYYDMVRVLEEFPAVRVTINVVPVLLDQIRAYGEGGSDLFLDTGAVPAEDLDEAQRIFLFDHFFSAQPERMIGELPRYTDLLSRRDQARRIRGPAEAWKEFATADYRDLQALFDLSWFGFKAREEVEELRALCRRGRAYSQENIEEIHAIERSILGNLLGLYRAAAARGQIEIASSPYAHPILPLLLDTDAAREALPRATLPPRFRSPEDARAQVEEALAATASVFGARPAGMWPSEGSVSQEAAELLAASGVTWTASDEEVLLRSEREGPADPCRPWHPRGAAASLAIVFRDHALSDRIGFSYARTDPAAAASAFVAEAVERSRRGAGEGGMILIALDGENPWEHYPNAGGDFLRALYGTLEKTPSLACLPVGEAIAGCRIHGTIRRLHAGSWIRADFGTWIGGPERNRAWALLARARAELAAGLRDPGLPESARREAWAAMRAAEGSDWFWWLDRQFPTAYRMQFDQIFRGHLRQAYEALGKTTPDLLDWPIPAPEALGEGSGLAEPAVWLDPRIDGFEGNYFEWQGSLRLSWAAWSADTTMQRAAPLVESVRIGFSRAGDLLLRLDPPPRMKQPAFAGMGIDLVIRAASGARQISVDLDDRGDLRQARLHRVTPEEGAAPGPSRPSMARAAARKILELLVSADEVDLRPGECAGILVRLRSGEAEASLREIEIRMPALSPDHARSAR